MLGRLDKLKNHPECPVAQEYPRLRLPLLPRPSWLTMRRATKRNGNDGQCLPGRGLYRTEPEAFILTLQNMLGKRRAPRPVGWYVVLKSSHLICKSCPIRSWLWWLTDVTTAGARFLWEKDGSSQYYFLLLLMFLLMLLLMPSLMSSVHSGCVARGPKGRQ